MEQRPLRLGDVVDDYCTRERRVTNHVIVALVEDAIRQTRCTTCDTEHAYKGAREPRLRKKEAAASVDLTHGLQTNGVVHAPPAVNVDLASSSSSAPSVEAVAVDVVDEVATESEPGNQADSWASHRRLIRATLPPTDEPPPPRPIPEFTMYQRPPARGARFRFRGGNPNGNGNGNGNGGQRDGFGNGRPGQGQGSGRSGRHRGRRRSR